MSSAGGSRNSHQAARDLALLLGPVAVGLARRLRGRSVIEHHSEDLVSRGGTAGAVRETLLRRPWAADDLRMIMGLRSEAEADGLLQLFGFSAGEDGLYRLGDEAEARLLRLAEDEVFESVRLGLLTDEESLAARLTTLVTTGERMSGGDAWVGGAD